MTGAVAIGLFVVTGAGVRGESIGVIAALGCGATAPNCGFIGGAKLDDCANGEVIG